MSQSLPSPGMFETLEFTDGSTGPTSLIGSRVPSSRQECYRVGVSETGPGVRVVSLTGGPEVGAKD